MCLLFLYLNDDERQDGYRMILANNRDEEWDRPTQQLTFWKDNPDCISGVDLTHGKEGGTWLGASLKGRIGILLNILGRNEKTKKGRGHLVNGFITSTKNGEDYIHEMLSLNASQYNSFNLILLDLSLSKTRGVRCSNIDGEIITEKLSNGIHTSDNSTFNKPWQKTIQNKGRFQDIVQKYNQKTKKDELILELMSLLGDRTQFEDDQQLHMQASISNMDKDVVLERSAAFVWSPQIRFGTRTHSIILVDTAGHCEFIEKTMTTPVNENDVQWETTLFTFKICDFSETNSHL